jgi:hypothetical protein
MSTERDKSAPAPAPVGGKRPYVTPVLRHEKVFEVMALACGKIGGTSGPCNAARKLS